MHWICQTVHAYDIPVAMRQEGNEIIFTQGEERLCGYASVLLANVPVVIAELTCRSDEIIKGSIASTPDAELELDLECELSDDDYEDYESPYERFQRGAAIGSLARRLAQFGPVAPVVALPTAAKMDKFLRDILDEAS